MSTMKYKGQTARIEFDAADNIFFGRLIGISDVIGFHADNVAELRTAFEEAVDDYIETCEKIGKPAQTPASGNMLLRVSPELHKAAMIAAEAQGSSLNKWATEVLSKAAHC